VSESDQHRLHAWPDWDASIQQTRTRLAFDPTWTPAPGKPQSAEYVRWRESVELRRLLVEARRALIQLQLSGRFTDYWIACFLAPYERDGFSVILDPEPSGDISTKRAFPPPTAFWFEAGIDNREGVPHRGAWTRDSVKDIRRRGRFYLGFVVEKRGRDERPGRHEPILTEAEYRRTTAAIAARTRVGQKPRPFRQYVLRGLVHCSCGTRMRGEAHLQRGSERRYYRCPTLGCRARRCPADDAEAAVLGAIAGGVLPDAVINAARAELRQRLQTPDVARVGRQRSRLLTRLDQLKKQHGWGDLEDVEYLRERDKVRAALRDLPDEDRVTSFDAYRAKLLALPDAIAVASPARREELCRIVVERVVVRDREVEAIDWTPPARPFFEKRQRECPQGASGTRPLSDEDPLAWYVA
jgi:hypothetical protein